MLIFETCTKFWLIMCARTHAIIVRYEIHEYVDTCINTVQQCKHSFFLILDYITLC